jgi:hypothetical protein
MKKDDMRKLKEVTLPSDRQYDVPEGWFVVKEPTKVNENGNDKFKIVIGSS